MTTSNSRQFTKELCDSNSCEKSQGETDLIYPLQLYIPIDSTENSAVPLIESENENAI